MVLEFQITTAFINAGKYARGGIIGSAFVKILGKDGNINENIEQFIKGNQKLITLNLKILFLIVNLKKHMK